MCASWLKCIFAEEPSSRRGRRNFHGAKTGKPKKRRNETERRRRRDSVPVAWITRAPSLIPLISRCPPWSRFQALYTGGYFATTRGSAEIAARDSRNRGIAWPQLAIISCRRVSSRLNFARLSWYYGAVWQRNTPMATAYASSRLYRR